MGSDGGFEIDHLPAAHFFPHLFVDQCIWRFSVISFAMEWFLDQCLWGGFLCFANGFERTSPYPSLIPQLVGGLEHDFCFPIQLGISILTDSYFSEGFKPPTRC